MIYNLGRKAGVMKIYLNHSIVPESEARVSVTDRGFLYGDGVFETMRAYGGEIFKLSLHIQRLMRSASLVGLDIGRDQAGIIAAIDETLAANELEDALIRVTVSRGTGPRGIDPTLDYTPTFVVMAWPFKPYARELFDKGVRLIIPNTRRMPPSALDPAIKSCNFLNNIMAKGEASRAGAFDALMLNSSGHLAECTISNIFFVQGGVVMTPSLECGILEGITRSHIIGLAKGLGMQVQEGEYTPKDIYGANEVFLSNTSMEVMPVSRVDSAEYEVGEVAGALLRAYAGSRP